MGCLFSNQHEDLTRRLARLAASSRSEFLVSGDVEGDG
jgi:hypothetical protein